MRILFLGVAAVALSGCSWLGVKDNNHHNSYRHNGYYGAPKVQKPCCNKTLSRWNLEAAAGPEFFVGGDAIDGDGINDINGVTSRDVKMKDAFDQGQRYEIGGSYALNPNRKVTLMGSYAEANGEQASLGQIDGEALTGQFSDYQRYGVEVGMRQYFQPKPMPVLRSVRPYVEGKLGAAHVDDIALSNAQLGGDVYNGGSVRLYESGWVPTAAGMVGFETPMFKRATVGVETGLRYTGKLATDTSDLSAGVPLAGANNGSDSWTVPVMLRGRYRF